MREILFRGKRMPDGKWVEGYINHNDTTLLSFIIMPKGIYDGVAMIRTETIGQYTGLKDKNGKRIFEGDVVTIPGSNKCGLPAQIHYYQRRGAFVIARIGYNPICLEDAEEWCEVIGNIHDNPELLKGGADHEH